MADGPCPVAVLWDPRFEEYDFGPDHPFTEKSRGLAVRLLEESGFFADASREHRRSFEPAGPGTLRRFHEAEYLDRVRRVSVASRRTLLDAGDTPSFPGCFEAAARLAEATVECFDLLRERRERHLFQPGGGLHHAHPDRASGFCIFNDLALLLRTAFDSGAISRAAYIDIDAHHGDGVMYGFFRDGRLLDIDFHQDGRTLFPGTGSVGETGTGDGAGLKVNVPLPPGAGDAEFLAAFRAIVPPMVREFRPELIVLQTGIDGHVGDPLAQLQYTPAAYREAVGTVHALAHEVAGGRLIETGGGGYRAESVARTLAQSAFVLAGAPADTTGAGVALPSGWRTAFRSTMGRPAPLTWGEHPAPSVVPGTAAATEAILRDLGRALGRSFRTD